MQTRISTQLNTANVAVARGATTVGTASAKAEGAIAGLGKRTEQSTAQMLGAASATGRLDAALLGLRTAVGSTAVIGLGALALAAIAVGQALRAMLVETAKFQQELATFRVTTGATAAEMTAVADAARRLGADVRLPAVSASDAAIAMTELAKAGLTVQESIAGAEGVLQLATAAQIDNAEAALLAANALNSFGLAGDQATRVADDLANAANASQGSITDMGIALRQASAVANQVGLSLEDTTVMLSLFAKNGLSGSDAGTSLRVALIRLVAPTKAAREEIQKLGLDIRDAQGNVRPDVFAQFGEATRNLSPAARDAAAALIFGQDAIRAVSIGAREGRGGLELMQYQIEQTGSAAELAGARTEGLAGSFGALQSNLQTLAVEMGSIVAGPLKVFLDSINSSVSSITILAEKLGKLTAIKIPPISIDVGVNVHFGGRTGKVGEVANEVKNVVSSAIGQAFAQAIIGPAATKAIQIKGIFDAISGGSQDANQKVKELGDQLNALTKARVEAFAGGDVRTARALTQRIDELKRQIDALKAAEKGVTVDSEQINHLQRAVNLLKDIPGTAPAVEALNLRIRNLIAGFQQGGEPIRDFTTDVGHLGSASETSAAQVDTLANAIKAAAQASVRASNELLKIQAAGGGPAAQLPAAQAKLAADIANLQVQLGLPDKKGRDTAIRQARQAVVADRAEVKSLQGEIAADNKKAADDAAKQQDTNTQNFIAQLDRNRQRIENRLSRVQITGTLEQQLAINRAIIAADKAEITAIKERIRHLHLHGEALKTAQAAIAAAYQDIFTTQNAIIQLTKQQQDRQKEAVDRRQQILQLDIQIAQARGNVGAERRAHEAYKAFLKNQISRHKGDALLVRQLRLELVNEEKALKELSNQTKKNLLAQQEFAFLQTIQGFTANLIGNLIPGGATGGLVGSGSGLGVTAPSNAPPPGSGLPFDRGGNPTHRLPALAAAAGGPPSPTRGQATSQIDWLHRIWQELHKLNRSSDHPEAKHQRQKGSAVGDTGGANSHGM